MVGHVAELACRLASRVILGETALHQPPCRVFDVARHLLLHLALEASADENRASDLANAVQHRGMHIEIACGSGTMPGGAARPAGGGDFPPLDGLVGSRTYERPH